MKHIIRNLALVLVICLFSIICSGCGGQEKQAVNILSANYEEQIELQLAYLRNKYPDAEINITYMSSGKLAAKLLAEGESTDVDIALSLSSAYSNQLKEAGLLLAYENETPYKAEYTDPDHMVLPNGVWSGAFLINTRELEKLNLPVPTSYADLLDPIYKGCIVMASPVSSATGYFFLLGILNLYGEDAGWNYFDQLSEQIMLYGESGSTPSSMVEKGEAVIGLGIDYEGIELVEHGSPIQIVFPDEGSPYDYDTVLLIQKEDSPSAFVLEIMGAITSIEGNTIFNNYNISVLEGTPDRSNYPENFKLLDMNGITDYTLKTEITEKWSNRYE